jgi:hypothetical protein
LSTLKAFGAQIRAQRSIPQHLPYPDFVGRLRVSVPLVHNLANLYYGKPFNYPLMQKNAYDLNAVFNLLQKKRCGSNWVTFAQTQELQAAMLFFRKRPEVIPYYQFYNSART